MSYRKLLRRSPDIRRVYLARLISFGGDWFLLVPLLGLVYELSSSSLLTAATLAANSTPAFLLSPWAGVLADRLDRKRIMVVSNLAAAAAVTALVFVDDLRSVPLAIVGIALVAAAGAFFTPASSAAFPNLVEEPDDLPRANLLVESAWGTMAVVGAALGGLVADAIGRDAAFLIDAVTFLWAALLIGRIKRPVSQATISEQRGVVAASRQALVYARHRPPVAALLTAKAGFGLFGSGGVVLLPILAATEFGGRDSRTGILFAARGLGVLVGPVLIRRFWAKTNRRLLGAIGWSMAAWGASYLLVAVSPVLLGAAVAVAIGHMGGGAQWAFSSYGLQVLTDDHIRGRIFALDFAAVTLTITFSQLLMGALAEVVSARFLVGALAAVGIGFGIAWARLTRRYWEGIA